MVGKFQEFSEENSNLNKVLNNYKRHTNRIIDVLNNLISNSKDIDTVKIYKIENGVYGEVVLEYTDITEVVNKYKDVFSDYKTLDMCKTECKVTLSKESERFEFVFESREGYDVFITEIFN